MHTQVFRLGAAVGPHGRRMGGHFGRPGVLFLLLLLVGAVVTLAILLSRSRRHLAPGGLTAAYPPGPWASGAPTAGPAATPPPPSPTATAEAILSERFARGEISVDDFVVARSALRGESVATSTSAPLPPTP